MTVANRPNLIAPAGPHPRSRRGWRASGRGGFTLIEVLAALLLLSIFIPVAMMATTQSLRMSETAKQRATAAGLAESKLAELIATGDWQSGSLSGSYGDDFPGFSWEAVVDNWSEANVQQIDVVVYWGTGRNDSGASVTVSSLAYVNNAAAGATGTTGTAAGGTTP
jgi:general secretion pathway protein I